MPTVVRLPALALLLAISAPASAVTPEAAVIITRIQATVNNEFYTGVPGPDEYSGYAELSTTSFLNETIATGLNFNIIDSAPFGPPGIIATNVSASWTRPNLGTVDFVISRDVQGNNILPSFFGVTNVWVYLLQTGSSRAVFSGSWSTSGNIAPVNAPAVFAAEVDGGRLQLDHPTPNSFSAALKANTNYGLTMLFELAGASPGDFDDAGQATAQVSWSIDAVPEPASWAMLITGFGLTGAGLRRQRALKPAHT